MRETEIVRKSTPTTHARAHTQASISSPHLVKQERKGSPESARDGAQDLLDLERQVTLP